MRRIILFFFGINLPALLFSQKIAVAVTRDPNHQKIIVTAGDQPFTEFIFADSIEKPILFPIYAAGGERITRGYPIAPQPGEPTDHPHHKGLWLNYENVNGLDFWNNSFAIPDSLKNKYGWIHTDSILLVQSGEQGILRYQASWNDRQKKELLEETTEYHFTAGNGWRIIDRVTTLKAQTDIVFPDAKDGLLGLRVARQLQLPSTEKKNFASNNGDITSVVADSVTTGNYLTSDNKTGNDAWGTRASWCLLYGKMGADSISILIIDHPRNPGYPTYWHARGYGLFAVNPLGQKIFSNGKEILNFSLKKGELVTFRYRIVIASGPKRISDDAIHHWETEFQKTP